MSYIYGAHILDVVLPTVVRRCAWSRNLKNMRSIYIWH